MRSIRLLLSVALALGFGACSQPHAPARNVLLITLDTTRFNSWGCMGNPMKPTPNIDRLATESVLYERCRTTTPLTVPAHASMLTGLYPPRHTIHANGVHPLPASARTLAEFASAAGVQTAAFVAAVVLDPSFGLNQGFATYAGVERSTDRTKPQLEELKAPQVVSRALEWLSARDRERPFLAWVHLFDAHDPYEPPPELAQAMKSGYLGEIAFVDRELGRLFDALRADGTLDSTLVVIVGDHGEGLMQHSEATHGWFCYDSTVRVPLLIRHPDGSRAGERSREIVSVVDVFSTALDALGLPAPGDIDGRNLNAGPAPDDHGVYFECFNGYENFGWSPLVGWADANGKYIHSSSPEYFEIESDKQEKRNAIAQHASDAARMLDQIRRMQARSVLERGAEEKVDPDARRALRGLGYVDSGLDDRGAFDPLAPTSRPAPGERKDELNLFLHASETSNRNQPEAALADWKALCERYPQNQLARSFYAGDLIRVGRNSEALAILEALGTERGLSANEWNSIGWCREQGGDLAGARNAYAKALELDPLQPWAKDNLQRVSGR